MIFRVEQGCFSYQELVLLQDINLTVQTGEMLAILGPNGVGKTTLVKCMLGFLSWSKGESLIDGNSIKGYSRNQLSKKIGYVPQIKTLPFSYTVEELVLMGRNPYINFFSQPQKEDYCQVEQVLKGFNLQHLLRREINQLSGGEIQLILIARALVAGPELLVLDEPELNLDLTNQLKIFETLSKLVAEEKIGCVINTHHPINALQYSQKSLLLRGKNEYLYGETREIVNQENLAQTYQLSPTYFNIFNQKLFG